jgi:hypothetical protein
MRITQRLDSRSSHRRNEETPVNSPVFSPSRGRRPLAPTLESGHARLSAHTTRFDPTLANFIRFLLCLQIPRHYGKLAEYTFEEYVKEDLQ